MEKFEDPDRVFRAIQKKGNTVAGIIHGRWTDGELTEYFHDDGGWQEFNDDTVAQYQKMYKTLRGFDAQVAKFEEERSSGLWYSRFKDSKVGMVYWQHPDSADIPLGKYALLSDANQFPGSPRQ